eukprot:g3238.t1
MEFRGNTSRRSGRNKSSSSSRKRVVEARRARDAARRRGAASVTLQRAVRGWISRLARDRQLTDKLAGRCTDLQRLWKVLQSRQHLVEDPVFIPLGGLFLLSGHLLRLHSGLRKFSRAAVHRKRVYALSVVLASHLCVSMRANYVLATKGAPKQSSHGAAAAAFAHYCLCAVDRADTPHQKTILASCGALCTMYSPEIVLPNLLSNAVAGQGLCTEFARILSSPSDKTLNMSMYQGVELADWWHLVLRIVCSGCSDTECREHVVVQLRSTVLNIPGVLSRDTEAVTKALSLALSSTQEWASRLFQIKTRGSEDFNAQKPSTHIGDGSASTRTHPLLWDVFMRGERREDHNAIRDNVANLCVAAGLVWFRHRQDVPSGLVLLTSLELRGMSRRESLKTRDQARADLINACKLLHGLLELEREASRKKVLHRRRASTLLLLAEFEFTLCHRFSAALATASQLLEMGAKRATFPLWKRAKELSLQCVDAQKAVRQRVRAFSRRARSDLKRAREAAARRMQEIDDAHGGELVRPGNARRHQKRRRQFAARKETAAALRAEAAAARERRRAAAHAKSLAFSKLNARRAAEKRLNIAAMIDKPASAAVQQAIEDSERECRAQAERILEMQKAMRLQSEKEAAERRMLMKRTRRNNKLEREQTKARLEADRAAEKKKSAELLRETERQERERVERLAAEHAAEEEEERAFAEAERRAREAAEEVDPRCLFCGAKKRSSAEACQKCFDGSTGAGAAQGAPSNDLWDFDDDNGDFDINDLVGGLSSEDESSTSILSTDEILSLEEALGMSFPDDWCCPLTLECFRDPVRMLEDGQVYERKAIEMWFARGNKTSPMTNIHVGDVPTLEDEVELAQAIDEAIDTAVEEMMREDSMGDAEEVAEEGLEEVAEEGLEEVAEEDGMGTGTEGDDTDSTKRQHSVSTLIRNADDAAMVIWSRAVPDKLVKDSCASCRSRISSTIARSKFKWVVICIASGRFAAGVFHRGVLVDHKTMSRYTTRRKQGGSQDANDTSGGGKAKSAGATLRRYNELEFHKDVHALLTESWKEYLAEADTIWISANKTSRNVLFQAPGYAGSKKKKKKKKTGRAGGALRKDNPAIQKVPFPTARPTLDEVRRVCRCAATCLVLPAGQAAAAPLRGPTIRRRIPRGAVLPLDTKARRDATSRVICAGFGEIMLWELAGAVGAPVGASEDDVLRALRRTGWRNAHDAGSMAARHLNLYL